MVGFAGLVLGYVLGHKAGKGRGTQIGLAAAPLRLREATLLSGRCQICGAGPVPADEPSEVGRSGNQQGGEHVRTMMEFVKMHGLGNDYLYVDLIRHNYEFDWPTLARALSDRHFGVGGDGLVLIMPSSRSDVRMRMFNADGSEGEMCGNAIRCVAKYLFDEQIVKARALTVETLAGDLRLTVEESSNGIAETVTVDMGEPRLEAGQIPILVGEENGMVVNYPVGAAGTNLDVTAVSMGNPHAVTFVTDLAEYPVQQVGTALERHPLFPNRVNVEFVEVHSDSEISMRVWERGSGETLACGTGACASVVAAVLTRRTGRRVTVHLRGGDLRVEWRETDGHVYMRGPATFVFSGQVCVSELLKGKKASPVS